MTSKSKKLAEVFHFDLYGKREFKYDFLEKNEMDRIHWNNLEYKEPYFFFIPKDFKVEKRYNTGIELQELFTIKSMGIATGKDKELVNCNKQVLENKYNKKATQFYYRPFDIRYTIFDNDILQRARYKCMRHLVNDNLSINIAYFCKTTNPHQLVSKTINCRHTVSGETYTFPLYLYPDKTSEEHLGQTTTTAPQKQGNRKPNLNMEIVEQIAEKIGLKFVPEKFPSSGGVDCEARRGGPSTQYSEARRGGPSEHSETQTQQQGKRNTQNYMNLPYNPKLKERAKELRKEGNLSEVLLWNQLKNKQFNALDFDRQKIIGNYIVDFYCSNRNVVIEIDGSSHNDKVEYDADRDAYLEGLGLTVIHIQDIDIKKNLSDVLEMLKNHPAVNENHPVPINRDTPPEEGNLTFAPIDLLDYIYGMLHSPNFRETFKEFLKIDFPRVPYPENADEFWAFAKLGSELRLYHLMEHKNIDNFITSYSIFGNNKVEKPTYNNGNVYINKEQYFSDVPEVAWNFYIGGYQPAQKWLKDRKGRTLSFEDIRHYQRIIVALTETDKIMKEIDKLKKF